MNTELTDIPNKSGILFYDAECPFCVRLAGWARPSLVRRRFDLLPLQTPGCAAKLGRTENELLAEMWLLLPDGTSLGGADALVEVSRHFWWAKPLGQIARVTWVRKPLRAAYYWVARHRRCANGICGVKEAEKATMGNETSSRTVDTLPLLILPMFAFEFRTFVAPWIFMWMMAVALYAGCKWLAYRDAVQRGRKPTAARSLGYLVGWLGMDAEEFLDRNTRPSRPPVREGLVAGGKTVCGAILLWVVARKALPGHPLVAGWIGMTGAIMVLHFGLFHLLALGWRRAGVKATPLMNKPLLAQSLAEFWGQRWNTAFNELAFRFLFRPLLRRTTPRTALLLVFGLSGLVHELVISLPVGGGYGLPTGYFMIQAIGMLAERTRPGRWIGLGHGLRGGLFAMFTTAGPAFWLFPPPFIQNVILPMLTAIGAT